MTTLNIGPSLVIIMTCYFAMVRVVSLIMGFVGAAIRGEGD